MTLATDTTVAVRSPVLDEEWKRFTPLMEKVVWAWSGSVDADYREDLRQEARIATWKALVTYDPDRGVRITTHVYHCIYHAVLNAVRAYGYDHTDVLSFETLLVEAALVAAPAAREVEEWTPRAFAERLEWDELRAAYLELDARDQQIVAWFYGGEETDAAIARRLGMGTVAVTKRRQRALQWLAERLRVVVHRFLCSAGLRYRPRRRGHLDTD